MDLLRNIKYSVNILECALPILQQVRYRQTKHWKPEFKRLRALKFIKLNLPNLNEKSSDLSQQELKKRLKERGTLPPRPWLQRPFHISCTGGIFEPYIPPEGDGKKSFISAGRAKQTFEFLEKKSKSMLAVRKIGTYEEDFNIKAFPQMAQDIYVEAHNQMVLKDKHKLREYITERCYPEMMHNIKYKTIHWKFLQSLEPPRAVHARVTDVISKENLFAQITVRFNTQQMLAIYDRFGRLIHGSEILAKDVLEYVVFEKHISNEYGKWRLHDKIVPDWMPPKEPALSTYRLIEDTPMEEIMDNSTQSSLVDKQQQLEDGSASQITKEQSIQNAAEVTLHDKVKPVTKEA